MILVITASVAVFDSGELSEGPERVDWLETGTLVVLTVVSTVDEELKPSSEIELVSEAETVVADEEMETSVEELDTPSSVDESVRDAWEDSDDDTVVKDAFGELYSIESGSTIRAVVVSVEEYV